MPLLTAAGRPDEITFPPTAPGHVKILAYRIGPLAYSRAVEHEWAGMFLLIPAIFAPTVALLFFALYLAIIIRPRRQRWLYSHGAAAVGTITNRFSVTIQHNTLEFISYTFLPASESQWYTGKASLAADVPDTAAAAGEAVTVLYDPAKPQSNAVYEYGGFRCD